jgi:hypothetical protein
MANVKFNAAVFVAVQAEKDETIQLPHLKVLVPRGDWVLFEPGDKQTGPVLVLANVQLKSMCQGVSAEDDAEIAGSIPEYVPGEPAPAEPAAEGAAELGPADA